MSSRPRTIRWVCVGVPVIHRPNPAACPSVSFHAVHQMPRVGAQVVQFGAILGRDDEAEMVPVIGTAFLEGFEVGVVGLRPVGPPSSPARPAPSRSI